MEFFYGGYIFFKKRILHPWNVTTDGNNSLRKEPLFCGKQIKTSRGESPNVTSHFPDSIGLGKIRANVINWR